MRPPDFTSDRSPLWVVTSYFNPAKYRRRYENFRIFRKYLDVPLLAVELSRTGDFQLASDDAEIVLQLTGEDRIWQKERLINLGIHALPDHVEYVVWMDCDVILACDDWPLQVMAQLNKHGGTLQPFGQVRHLTRAATETAATLDQFINGDSFFSQTAFAVKAVDAVAYFEARNSERADRTREDKGSPPKAKVSSGLAWAARRNEIQKLGLYDRSVIGSGDIIYVSALYGWVETLLEHEIFGDFLRSNVMTWARDAKRHIPGPVESLSNDIVHLWHGAFENRRYRNRHEIMIRHGYNPERDIQLAENGTWNWSEPEGSLARDVAAYFESRREDG